jgi:capsular polysaccharide transport system permease protein
VLLPTVIAALYYGLIAADLYASEARFVVHSQAKPQIAGLSGLLQGGGLTTSHDDVYTVHDYILSRDALKALAQEEDLGAFFSRPEADWLSRYPNWIYGKEFEDFYRYYGHRVDVVFDATTGITTLTVKAFRAEDAQRIAGRLLDLSEALVNRMNDRSRANAVADAELEVKSAEARVAEAQASVLSYRNRERLLDPGKSSGAVLEAQARLQTDINATRLRLAQVESASPQSPVRSELTTKLRVLDSQLNEQRSRMAGSESSFAPKISEYEKVVLNQDFSERELTSALASLETAKVEARRQQIYLDRVVEPNQPDLALFPKRFESILIVLITCFIAYTIGALLLAGVREHEQA